MAIIVHSEPLGLRRRQKLGPLRKYRHLFPPFCARHAVYLEVFATLYFFHFRCEALLRSILMTVPIYFRSLRSRRVLYPFHHHYRHVHRQCYRMSNFSLSNRKQIWRYGSHHPSSPRRARRFCNRHHEPTMIILSASEAAVNFLHHPRRFFNPQRCQDLWHLVRHFSPPYLPSYPCRPYNPNFHHLSLWSNYSLDPRRTINWQKSRESELSAFRVRQTLAFSSLFPCVDRDMHSARSVSLPSSQSSVYTLSAGNTCFCSSRQLY